MSLFLDKEHFRRRYRNSKLINLRTVFLRRLQSRQRLLKLNVIFRNIFIKNFNLVQDRSTFCHDLTVDNSPQVFLIRSRCDICNFICNYSFSLNYTNIKFIMNRMYKLDKPQNRITPQMYLRISCKF